MEGAVMAVAWFRNPVLDESADVIDRDSVNERTFGVTTAKRKPNYVYSIHRNACLMHKVRDVEIQWYALLGSCGSKMGRLKQPAMIAHTVCGMSKALIPEKTRTCAVPEPDSVLCGRCHGDVATFGKHGAGTKAGIKRGEAHVKLGCVEAGYPSSLARNNLAGPAGGAPDAEDERSSDRATSESTGTSRVVR
jgi:hypothetical protein